MFVASAGNVNNNPITRAAAECVARRVERNERAGRIAAWVRATEDQVLARRQARRVLEEQIAAMAAGRPAGNSVQHGRRNFETGKPKQR